MGVFIGIDLGTTSLKIIGISESADHLFTESIPNVVITKGRSKELDMAVLWNSVCTLIKDTILKHNLQSKNILAVGICGQGEGLFALDANKKPFQNAILWNDNRAVSLVNSLNEDIIIREKIKNITGSFPFSGATSVLLTYLKTTNPKNYKNIQYVLFCKDYIRFCLTGKIYTDYTDASTSLLNLKTKNYSKELFALLGISDIIDKLPELKSPFDLGGTVSREVAKLTGLLEGTPVSVGMLDLVSAFMGNGAKNINDVSITLGTTSSAGIILNNDTSLNTLAGFEMHYIDSKLIEVMATMSGAGNLNWIEKIFFTGTGCETNIDDKTFFEYLDKNIPLIPPGSLGVMYLPFISQGGERMPFNNPNARASFVGLSQNVSISVMIRSVMEGVGFSILDCLKHLSDWDKISQDNKIFLSGGGASSAVWPQIISDILGKNIMVIDGKAFSARGAAYSALYCYYKTTPEKTNLVDFSTFKLFKPNIENYKLYEKMYNLYYKLRLSQAEMWDELKQIRDISKNLIMEKKQ